jgi:hypothetical protein
MPPRQPPVGVTVMPEWFACEGIEPVLDRLQALGATAIATSPYVLEVAPDGEGSREPPVDAGAGRVRPLDRALYGRHELWVRTAPAFEHDFSRYAGMRYQPSPASALTARHGGLIDRVVEKCTERGIAMYLQVMAASPPGYRVQFSVARPEDQCLGPDGQPHSARVDKNASLASDAVSRYTATLVAELASRYPGVTGFRLDWPEYPPYDLRSALFDFNPAAQALMARRGHDPARIARAVLAWTADVRESVARAAAQGCIPSAFTTGPWTAIFDASGPLGPLFAAKRDAALALLKTVRQALDNVPGKRRRLEPQAFPPPFHRISGFPLDGLADVADAVGIKLYTMHWPMIARFWATDLLGASSSEAIDATTSAVAGAFGLTDEPVDGALLRYPEPQERHPAGVHAQRDKPALAQAIAGDVPVVVFAHTYGPLDDVVRRCTLAASTGLPLWLNRYGYLSDAKIDALGRALPARPRQAPQCATFGR